MLIPLLRKAAALALLALLIVAPRPAAAAEAETNEVSAPPLAETFIEASQRWNPSAPRRDASVLSYALKYEPGTWSDPGKLVLHVTNPTPHRISVEFPSGLTHSFEVKRAGKEAWNSSAGKHHVQAVQRTTFRPWETKTYSEALPWLPPAWYQVNAHYFAKGAPSKPVASSYIHIGWRSPIPASSLKWDLDFTPKNWSSSYNRFALQVRNTSNRDLRFYNPQGVECRLLVQDVAGKTVWQYEVKDWDSDPFTVYRAGSARYHFITAPNLKPGWYVARAYSPLADGRMVAETWFSIR